MFIQVEAPQPRTRYVLVAEPEIHKVHWVESIRRKNGKMGTRKPCLDGQYQCPNEWHRYAAKELGYLAAIKSKHKPAKEVRQINPEAAAFRDTLMEQSRHKPAKERVGIVEATREAQNRFGPSYYLVTTTKAAALEILPVGLELGQDLFADVLEAVEESGREWRGLTVRFSRREYQPWEIDIDPAPPPECLPDEFELKPALYRMWNVNLPAKGTEQRGEDSLKFPATGTDGRQAT